MCQVPDALYLTLKIRDGFKVRFRQVNGAELEDLLCDIMYDVGEVLA